MSQIFCGFVMLVYVSLHQYNMATKKWFLFKSLSAFCYLALTVLQQAHFSLSAILVAATSVPHAPNLHSHSHL